MINRIFRTFEATQVSPVTSQCGLAILLCDESSAEV
jgi:hypothetical protein